MNCSEYENLITEYLENRATHSQRNLMESHLSKCEKCRDMAKKERAVMEQLREIQFAQCPDEIITSVMKSIPEKDFSFTKRIMSWFSPGPAKGYFGVASFSGSLVILLLAFFLFIPGQKRQRMERVEYTQEEIIVATNEVKLALAYFSVYSRKTESALQKIDLIEPLIKPIEGEFKKALGIIPYI